MPSRRAAVLAASQSLVESDIELDSHINIDIDDKLVTTAVKALKRFAEKHKKNKPTELIESDGFISLVVTMFDEPKTAIMQPFQISIPYSLFVGENDEICLITKDPQKEFKEKLAKHPVNNVTKVLGISKLRSNFKSYEQKRELCAAYDLFLADERIIKLLPHLLGKAFFKRKKQPIPVNISASNLMKTIVSSRDSSYLFISRGTCSAVKIARVSFTVKQIVENILSCVEGIIVRLPGGKQNLQSLAVKMSESVALPFYNALPRPPQQFDEDNA